MASPRAENCARARNDQRTLDSGMRIVPPNDKGEREIIDDQGRAEEMRARRQVIASRLQ